MSTQEESVLGVNELGPVLAEMEDKDCINKITRCKSYNVIAKAIEQECFISEITTLDRIIDVCVTDLKTDLQYCKYVLLVHSNILNKIKEGKCDYSNEKLVESAHALSKVMQKVITKPSIGKLTTDIFLLYPDETLKKLFVLHTKDIIGLIDYTPQAEFQYGVTEKVVRIIDRFLKILPHEEKIRFVRFDVGVWFRTVIPGIVAGAAENPESVKHNIATLEKLTELLKTVNYDDYPDWSGFLLKICSRERYPAILKSLLQSKNEYWHKLWMVFITLLKDKITKSINDTNPINALLPVLEIAFKMDAEYRIQAFECWNVLIDNLSMELDESALHKRLRLIMIPLLLHNAKVESVVVAKINTWWHLIRCYHSKMNVLTDTVLVPFLNYCFVKKIVDSRAVLVEMSDVVAKRCLEVLVEIIGHVDCNGCCTTPIPSRLITNKLLEDRRALWLNAVHCVFKAASNHLDLNDLKIIQQLTCLWKGFVNVIAELSENQSRADLCTEMLKLIESLSEVCKDSSNKQDVIVWKILLKSLVCDPRVGYLLKTKADISANQGPLHLILRIVQNAIVQQYQHLSNAYLEGKFVLLKRITERMLDPHLTDPEYMIEFLLRSILPTPTGLLLWAAMADSIRDYKRALKQLSLFSMVLRPLQTLQKKENVELFWYKWYFLYIHIHSTTNCKDLDEEIEMMLTGGPTIPKNSFLHLCAAVALLKQMLLSDQMTSCENAAQIVIDALTHWQEYKFKNMDNFCPILTDTVIFLLNKVTDNISLNLAKSSVLIVQNVHSLINLEVLENSPKPIYLETLQNGAKEALHQLYRIEAYASLKPIIATALDSLSVCRNKDAAALMSINTNDVENQGNSKVVTTQSIEQKKDSISNNFSVPTPKIKKTKTKAPSVVRKVVENGEEYEVIRSNWKFNPKKLTENQKEKFTRKREDIPALYQDLSQSQEEFRLSTWQTDSQDASTTASSKSDSNSKPGNDNLVILQALPSTEVVPKIIENILIDANKNSTCKATENAENNNELSPSVKKSNTPRLALKDRVFRNVRNLIKKSDEGKSTTHIAENINLTVNQSNVKTPDSKAKNTPPAVSSAPRNLIKESDEGKSTTQIAQNINLTVNQSNVKTPDSKAKDTPHAVSSAPPKISTKRPYRSTKTPKKFDECELFLSKKRRRSEGCSPSDKIQLEELEKDQEIANKSTTDKVNIDPEITEQCIQPGDDKAANLQKETVQVDPVQDNHNKTPDNIAEAPDEMVPEESKSQSDSREQPVNTNNDDTSEKNMEQSSTPEPKDLKKKEEQSATKRKRSRIEKQLLIDMVEGHPILQPTLSEKRMTRKKLNTISRRRKSLIVESNAIAGVIDQTEDKSRSGTKFSQQKAEMASVEQNSQTVTIIDSQSQEHLSQSQEDIPMSEDIIESSQDSTLTTISVKSNRKKTPLVSVDNKSPLAKCKSSNSQKLLDNLNNEVIPVLNDSSDDRENIRSPNTISMQSPIKMKIPLISLVKINPLAKYKTSDTKKLIDDLNTEVIPLPDDSTGDSREKNRSPKPTSSKSPSKNKIHIVTLVKENLPVQCKENDEIGEKTIPLDKIQKNSTEDSREDIELSKNKTMSESDLTEDMDTEPFDSSGEVILVNDNVAVPIVINTEDTFVGKETQEIAEADTLPVDATQSEPTNADSEIPPTSDPNIRTTLAVETKKIDSDKDITNVTTQEDVTSATINDIIAESSNTESPFKDEVQRKKDFLNNTTEISPIKTLSPVREEKSSSPESNSNYVVIKLTTPVQSNGEPFSEKCDSPEIFTNDKVSPDKRDQSPPRKKAVSASSSPSSLSLKKNRPAMSRAAQMLGLAAPGSHLKLNFNNERCASDERKKSTPAKRNLKRSYNLGEKSENIEHESKERDKFLELTRAEPTPDCSPANPILKRQSCEIADEATASKQKRVSFHDPPVSTTVAVEKYIEPFSIRSPSNSSHKRLERQTRSIMKAKSSKRLDNMFRLDTFLTKAVESFSDDTANGSNETEMSLDETPAAEIIKTSDLNNSDPICPELVDCKDPIENIAGELSSGSTKSSLVKELEGKVETISDLAKMTELEVNRLCIKAPKVKVAKKVLTKYALEKAKAQESVSATGPIELEVTAEVEKADMAVQTNDGLVTKDSDMQTAEVATTMVCSQTELATTHSAAQTNETGRMPAGDAIDMYLKEGPEFFDQLSKKMKTPEIARNHKLPDDVLLPFFMMTLDSSREETIKKALSETYTTKDERSKKARVLSSLITHLLSDNICDNP